MACNGGAYFGNGVMMVVIVVVETWSGGESGGCVLIYEMLLRMIR